MLLLNISEPHLSQIKDYGRGLRENFCSNILNEDSIKDFTNKEKFQADAFILNRSTKLTQTYL